MSQNALNNQTYDADFIAFRQPASAGTTCFIQANHLDTTNPGSSAQVVAQSTAASGADAYHVSALASTRAWCHGIDASDAGALKETTFAGGSTSPSTGTLTRKVTTAGEQTMPLQPAFRATLTAPVANVTGGGGGPAYEILFDDDAVAPNVDQGADYNPATGRFTAPVAGVYSFSTTVFFTDVGASHTQATVAIALNAGASMGAFFGNPVAITAAATTTCGWNASATLQMAAGDFVSVFLNVIGAAQVIDVSAGSSFSGKLVC